MRHTNHGLRKICRCSRRVWAKCPHPWHLNFKWQGVAYRFSLDRALGKRIELKADALAAADQVRTAIRAGTFHLGEPLQPEAPKPAGVTFAAFAVSYLKLAVKTSGKRTWRNDATMLSQIADFVLADGTRLAARPIAAVTEDALEEVLHALRAKGRAASTRNKYVQLLKAAFRWAVRKGYVSRTPIGPDSSLRREQHARRSRRLRPDVLTDQGVMAEPGEERALLAVASPRLQRFIIAAIETGCRQGELLTLRWSDVNLERRELTIRAEHAKDAETRVLPISSRLAGVLEMATLDPAGRKLPPEAFVFGDGIERPIGAGARARSPCARTAPRSRRRPGTRPSSFRTARRPPGRVQHGLSAASQAALEAIDLHFHDLRHEAGSRLLEAGWPIHHVKEMLGHADIKTTDTYLNSTRLGLQESMRKVDDARTRCNPVADSPAGEQPPVRNGPAPEDRNVLIH